MNKDSLILIGAVFIIFLVGFISFTYQGFTGSLIKVEESKTIVKVLTKEIKSGEYVKAYIIPGSRGVEKELEIFKDGKTHRMTSFYEYNAKSRYSEPFIADYKTYGGWEPAKYWVVAHDIASGKTSRDYFIISS